MPGYRLKIPNVILLESIDGALFVRDFNVPAVASNACDAMRLPVQWVGDKARGGF
jgi:hypothetical protein